MKAHHGHHLKLPVNQKVENIHTKILRMHNQPVEVGTSELFRDSANCNEPTQRNQATWFPAGPDLIPTAECCIDAVNKYSYGRRSCDDTINVRKHLLFLGWKIEVKKVDDVLFFRYTEPLHNKKPFVSLVRVCEYLRESTPKPDELSCSGIDKILVHTSQRAGLDILGGSDESAPGILSEAPQDDHNNLIPAPGASSCTPTEQSQEYREELVQLDVEAEYGPKAVLDYYSGLGKRDDKLASKAKQHLSYVGWKFYSVPKVNKIPCRTKFRYSSPNGVLYHTLLSACRACIDEGTSDGNDYASEQRKTMHSGKDSKGRRGTHRSVTENQPTESSGIFLSWEIDLGDVRGTKRHGIKRKSICSNYVSPSSKSQNKKLKKGRPNRSINRLSGHVNTVPEHTNDDICSVCHYGGELVMCDQCPSSFHTACINLKDIPEGDWFCPSCCCKICGNFNIIEKDEVFRENNAMNCHQCERKYHIGCLRKTGIVVYTSPTGHWFCKRSCEQLFFGLQKFLWKTIPVGVSNLTWILMKHTKPGSSNIGGMPDIYGKLNLAVDVMHEGFQPMKEIRTGKDLVEDVIFNRRYELNHLNYQGFYTVVLEENDEVIVAATLRVFGEQVAEIPLVATRFRYRCRGMCRILMNELEKALSGLGVKRIVLPAVKSSLDTWIFGFGFSEMTQSQRHEFVEYSFLNFQGTKMCQKVLLKTPNIESAPQGQGPSQQLFYNDEVDKMDLDETNPASGANQVNQNAKSGVAARKSS